MNSSTVFTVMTPGHQDVSKTAFLFVDSKFITIGKKNKQGKILDVFWLNNDDARTVWYKSDHEKFLT